MIPRLFEHDASMVEVRDGNGLGWLASCTRCIVIEERNGIYECEFDYPVDGELFEEIKIGRMIACPNCEGANANQPFDIYARSVPDLNGIVTFRAHHISYRMNDIVVMPFHYSSAVTQRCQGALNDLKRNSIPANSFWFWTDKTDLAHYELKAPRTLRGLLGGEEGSILDVYGTGEYLFNGFNVYLYKHRGVDTNVEIVYGKNLTSLEQEIDASGCYNAIVPFWTDADGNATVLTEKIISYASEGEYVDAVTMDLTDAFEEQPSQEDLRAKAKSRYESGDSWLPTENLKIDFVHLWQTEEYKEFAPLQRVNLCDTVNVSYPQLGIEKVKQKVVRVEYNVLLERYDSIELGALRASLGQSIRESIISEVTANSVTKSMMQAAIDYATEMIRGGLGGYVVMTPGANGYPQEILIMDTPDVNTAVNVWRFNKGGLGHSHNGYNGPFSDIALTQDGRINATMITTGALNANLITTGVINADLITAGTISDGSGLNYWNIANGLFVTKQGTIGAFSIDSSSLKYDTSTRYILLDSYQFTVTRKVDWMAGGSSVLGARIYNGTIDWVGTSGGTNPKSYSQQFKAELSQSSYGDIYFTIGDPTEHVVIDMYPPDWDGHQIQMDAPSGVYVVGDFVVGGTKPRAIKTQNYGTRLNYCYETPTPLFGDIGEAVISEDGLAYVDIDDIFGETINTKVEYQVFLQKECEGDCWIADKQPHYFVIQGTPNLKVAWELKAKQRDYETLRLEPINRKLSEYEYVRDDNELEDFIKEQEELLYG